MTRDEISQGLKETAVNFNSLKPEITEHGVDGVNKLVDVVLNRIARDLNVVVNLEQHDPDLAKYSERLNEYKNWLQGFKNVLSEE